MDDWFEETFALGVDKISLIVGNVCRYWDCQRHADEVAADVMVRVYLQHCADPHYFKTKKIDSFIHSDTRFMLLHLFRTPQHVEYRDPQQLPDRAYVDDSERERLLSLLADCDQAVKLLAGADPKVQEVFLLGCNGMKNEEIAQKLSISKATVKRRRQAALKALKHTLSETDLGTPPHGGHQR